ncbi:hypothetical protein [Massilia endophytica]|uniref:hypothetical protein n=1 Tax=Massilia endophytica TaxID=2899220 RepID=UPI001E2A8689|nr:hypothetical protein [Massilia endophytica]UGQ47758.1 hypothetical protein LSQ66_04590 [Massilia endophytica]
MSMTAMARLLCCFLAAGVLLAGYQLEQKEAVMAWVADSAPVRAVMPQRAVPAKLTPAGEASAASADASNGLAGYTVLYRNGAEAPLPERTKAIRIAIDSEDFAAADALAIEPELKALVAEGRRLKQLAVQEEMLTASRDREAFPGAEK